MKVNTVGKVFSVTNRAYLAGFIDGDGAIMACIERHKEKRFKFRVRVILKITQSQKKDVAWIRRLTGAGYIGKNRDTFEWVVKDQIDGRSIIRLILPYLHSKKTQAKIALKILAINGNAYNDFYRKACLADALSAFNVRSKNRRKNFAVMIKKNTSRND